jgi:hypothetical protein
MTKIIFNFEKMEVVYFIGVNRLKLELEYIAPDNTIWL